MFRSPGYIAFSFASIDVHWYGIIMALAIIAGIFTVILIKNKYYKEITSDSIIDISFILIIFGIISARLYYVILDYKFFIKHPYDIIAVWNGGISIQGAIIGGIIAFYIYSKIKKLDFLRYADLLSFGVIVGQIIGRWGNFFNSEAFGLPTNLPWKMYIPFVMRPLEYRNFEFFHPAFIYESLLNIVVLLVMLYILNYKKDRKSGFIFLIYLILYSFVRILVESIRLDSVLSFSFIHAAHIASAIFIIVSFYFLLLIKKQ